jgi:DNA replication protein DnaC
VTAADLVLQLEKARREHRFDQYLKRAILGPSLLILNEIRYLPLKKDQSDLFFQVVAKRYEQGSVILTSNLSFGDWEETSTATRHSPAPCWTGCCITPT